MYNKGRYAGASEGGIQDVGEGHIFILGCNYYQIVQGTWEITLQNSQFLNGYMRSSSSHINDEIHYLVYLNAGTYTIKILGYASTNYGIASIYLDTTLVASLDFYSAIGAYNVIKTQTGITVGTSGLYTLKLKMATKNGASDGYGMRCGAITLFRTA